MKTNIFILLLAGLFLMDRPSSVRADILDHWTTTQLTTNYFYMTAIAYGNGEWVATSQFEDGVCYYYSADGLNWAAADFFTGAWGSAMKFDNGHFIGVGGYGTVFDSTNGIDWQAFYLPNGYTGDYTGFGDVTYGNGLYVDVGKTNGVGYILASRDGTNWVSKTLSTSGIINTSPPMGGYICSITYGNFRFVAVGDNDGLEYFSYLGGIWHQYNIPAGGNEVVFANGSFFIPLSGTNLISSDGIHWIQQPTGLINSYIQGITYAHGLYMGSANGCLVTSTDGANWVRYPNRSGFTPLATDGTRVATIWSVYIGPGYIYGYDGYVSVSDPLVDFQLTSSAIPDIALYGLVGRQYQLQSSDSLGATANWQTNTTVTLTNSSYFWLPPTSKTNSSKFFRAALLP